MSIAPETEDGQQELVGEIRSVLRQEFTRHLGGQPPPGGGPEWQELLKTIYDKIDRVLPRTRKDVLAVREEFERAIARLRPPDPIDTQGLREVLDRVFPEDAPKYEEARARWKKDLERILPSTGKIEKVIVAVHGIGDQFNFATVQQTAHAFCRYMGVPAAFPLGRFHGRSASGVRALVPKNPPDPPLPQGREGTPENPVPWTLAFAEIYWANIPREVIKEGYTLEEAKQWARTLVERLRYKAMQGHGNAAEDEASRRAYDHFGRVVDDIIESAAVGERLLRVVRYAGFGDFQLKKILDDYLNDVQAVAEFYTLRRQLLDTFTVVMRQVSLSAPEAEIHIVAHSEGTVVSFLGLLEGLANGEEWVKKVKGLMTFGCPLNKHVLLWREIFDEYKAPAKPPGPPIKWHNYYEHGDPIGNNLRITYDWMVDKSGQHWERFFDFKPESHDHGYSHSPWPGEAHNHYWQDDKVFGHFISNVVDPEGTLLKKGQYKKLPKPDGEWINKVLSYTLPYVFSSLILFLGTFLLYKAARVCINPVGAERETPWEVLNNALVLTALIAGTTALATLPRLLTLLPGLGLGLVFFAIGAVLFVFGCPPLRLDGFDSSRLDTLVEGWLTLLRGLGVGWSGLSPPPWYMGPGIIVGLAALAGISAGYRRWRYPERGLKPMVLRGAIAVVLAIGPAIYQAISHRTGGDAVVAGAVGTVRHEPVWPVVLAFIAFLYLWWLATLLFDMSFVWHGYVRREWSQKYLERIAKAQPRAPAASAPSGTAGERA